MKKFIQSAFAALVFLMMFLQLWQTGVLLHRVQHVELAECSILELLLIEVQDKKVLDKI